MRLCDITQTAFGRRVTLLALLSLMIGQLGCTLVNRYEVRDRLSIRIIEHGKILTVKPVNVFYDRSLFQPLMVSVLPAPYVGSEFVGLIDADVSIASNDDARSIVRKTPAHRVLYRTEDIDLVDAAERLAEGFDKSLPLYVVGTQPLIIAVSAPPGTSATSQPSNPRKFFMFDHNRVRVCTADMNEASIQAVITCDGDIKNAIEGHVELATTVFSENRSIAWVFENAARFEPPMNR